MKTVSLVGSVSRQAGGLFESVRRLHQELVKPTDALTNSDRSAVLSLPTSEAITVSVLGIRDRFTDLDLAAWRPVPVYPFAISGPAAFGYRGCIHQELTNREPALVHVHGLWQYQSMAARDWHRKTRRPYLVSPHGMLDAWALDNSSWKKRIAWWAYEGEHLRSAACIRALCEAEAESIRSAGLRNPICIIPNGVDLPQAELGQAGSLSQDQAQTDSVLEKAYRPFLRPRAIPLPDASRKLLLYLGRIHPKKGLARLLEAWAKLRTRGDWVLAIAGWDQGGHELELKRLASELGLAWADRFVSARANASVLFVGPQFGAAKKLWLKSCHASILPSFSEGLPMAVLEAWAFAKPVLMTPQCNLPEGFASRAAISLGATPKDTVRGLEQLIVASDSTLASMGARGMDLVEAHFTWPSVAEKFREVYQWLNGAHGKPACVWTV